MSGPLILAGTERWVFVINGQLATLGGRLIVATTIEERDAGVGTPVPLPPEWMSVSEWLQDQGADPERIYAEDRAAAAKVHQVDVSPNPAVIVQ